MKINDAMRTYRLPNPTTPEDLECRWSKLLTFGDRVVIAGYFFQRPEQALLLRGGLRIPGRRPYMRRRHRTPGGKRSRVRG